MIEAMAAALPRPQGAALRLLLRPRAANLLLDRIGDRARMLDPLLHNTVSATVLRTSDKFNVIPAEVSATLDGRLLPGFAPDDLLAELRALLGDDVALEVTRFDAGPSEPDMSLYPVLADILERADPGSTATPLLMPGVSDGRFFARLGIQTYGFLPMKLPRGFDFWSGVHGADERIPVGAIEFGAEAVHSALERFGEPAP
jgi:acetylornithine deacetylase/succinyl-diaminopimelate desuccinylase-like protein